MAEQKCPSCGLYSPPSTERCDCGYNFARGTMPAGGATLGLTRGQGLAIVVLLAVLVIVTLGRALLSAPDRFEYEVLIVPDGQFKQQMDQAGDARWEAVSARRALDGSNSNSASYEVIFKRRK